MKKQVRILMLALVGIAFLGSANAQVKVGDNPTTIDARSLLEMESDSLALYLPRLTTTQRDATFPGTWKEGMMIYNSTDDCIQFYDGTTWDCLGSTAGDNHLGDSNQVIPAATNRNITLTNRQTTKINIAPAGEEASISALNVIGGNAGGGSTAGITVSSNYTDSATKLGIIKTPQYLNSGLSVQALSTRNTATANELWIGGYSSSTQASPSVIHFNVDRDTILTNANNPNSHNAMTIRDSVILMRGKGGNSTTGGESRSIATRLPGKTIYDAGAENTFGRIASGLDFNWFSNKWTIGATRGSGTQIDAFVFAKDSVEMLNIDANGNVGIGTTDPTEKLDVDGNVRVRSLPLGSSDSILVADGTGVLGYRTDMVTTASDNHLGDSNQVIPASTVRKIDLTSDADLDIDTATLFVDGSANNVGIGTTAPESRLHVVGGDTVVAIDGATTNILHRVTNAEGGSAISMLETGVNQMVHVIEPNRHTYQSIINGVRREYIRYTIANETVSFGTNSVNVGIGNVFDATARLDVGGDVRVRNLPTGDSTDQIVSANAVGNLRKQTAAQIVAAGGGITTASDNHLGDSNQVIPADTNRFITLGNTNTSKLTIAPAGQEPSISTLNVIGGNALGGSTAGITVSSNYTDSATKLGIIKTPQYLNSGLSVQALSTRNTATANELWIGGYSSGSQASPSVIHFNVDRDTILTNSNNPNRINAMTIQGVTGNVGIGDNAPEAKLEIATTTGQEGITIRNGNKTGHIIELHNEGGTGLLNVNTSTGIPTVQMSGNLDSISYILSQRLGIGTTSPNEKLDVVGNTAISGTLVNAGGGQIVVQGGQNGGAGRGIYLWNTANTDRGIYMAANGTNRSLAGNTTAVAGFGWTGIATRFRMDDNAINGWIFENSSDDRLVSINSASGNAWFAGTLTSLGNMNAPAFTVTSDARLKTNVVSVNNALATISLLNPVAYDKKETLESEEYTISEYGFIAQELREVLPTLVSEDQSEDKMLAVNYTALIPILTKAIQELKAELDAEKEKNEILEARCETSDANASTAQSQISSLESQMSLIQAALLSNGIDIQTARK